MQVVKIDPFKSEIVCSVRQYTEYNKHLFADGICNWGFDLSSSSVTSCRAPDGGRFCVFDAKKMGKNA